MFLSGEVILIRMHFHQSVGAKVRPADIILDTGDADVVAAPITSLLRQSKYDLIIKDWQAAGLNVASAVRVHKLTVLARIAIIRTVGSLSDADRGRLTNCTCSAFCP